MKRIIVKFYFDKELRVLGFIIGLFSWIIGIMTESWWAFGLAIVIASLLFWTQYEVTLNRTQKYYKRALLILGIRFGKKVLFEKMETCQIIKGKYTDLYMLGPFGIDSEGDMYHAFIKFSDGHLLQIGKNKNRSQLLGKINFFRFDYGIDIIKSIDDKEVFRDKNTLIRKSIPRSKTGKDLTITGFITLLFSIATFLTTYSDGAFSLSSVVMVGISVAAIVIGIFKIKKIKKYYPSSVSSDKGLLEKKVQL